MKKTNKLLALLLSVMVLMSCFVPVVTVSAETTAPTATTKESWTVNYDFTNEEDAAKITDTNLFTAAGTTTGRTVEKVTDYEGDTALRMKHVALTDNNGTIEAAATSYYNIVLPGKISKDELVHAKFKIKKSATEQVQIGWSTGKGQISTSNLLFMLPLASTRKDPWIYLLGRNKANTGDNYFGATSSNPTAMTYTKNDGTNEYAEIELIMDRKNKTVRAKLNGEEFEYFTWANNTLVYDRVKPIATLQDMGDMGAVVVAFTDYANAYNSAVNGYKFDFADYEASGPYFKSIYVGSVFDEIEEKITALANETDAAKKLRKAIEINAEIKEYTDLGYSTDKIENYADLAALLPDVTTNKASWTVDYDFTTEEDAAKITDTNLFCLANSFVNKASIVKATDYEGKTALRLQAQVLSKSGETVSASTEPYMNVVLPGNEGITKNDMVHINFKVKKNYTEVFKLGWSSAKGNNGNVDFFGMMPLPLVGQPWMYLVDKDNKYLCATTDKNSVRPLAYTPNGSDAYAEVDLYMDRKNGTVKGKINGEEFAYTYGDSAYKGDHKYNSTIDGIANIKVMSLYFKEWVNAYNNSLGGYPKAEFTEGQLSGPYIRSIYVGSVFDEIEDRIKVASELADRKAKVKEGRAILAEINEYKDLGYDESNVENYELLRAILADEVEISTNTAPDLSLDSVTGIVNVKNTTAEDKSVQMVAVGFDSADNMVAADMAIVLVGAKGTADETKTFEYTLANTGKDIKKVKIMALQSFATIRPYTVTINY